MSLNVREDERMQVLLRRSWTDADFKRRLLDDPTGILREEGWEIPAGMTVVVVEETETTRYLTLPSAPQLREAELSATQTNELVGEDRSGPPTYSIYLSEPCSRQGCAAYPESVLQRSRAETARRRLETAARQ